MTEVKAKMAAGEQVLFFDTRPDISRQAIKVRIPGARTVSNGEQMREVIQELAKESFIVAYCT